jgi:hypothetical protein
MYSSGILVCVSAIFTYQMNFITSVEIIAVWLLIMFACIEIECRRLSKNQKNK